MGTSPDVGGSRGLGRPQFMDYREMEQTAQANLGKQQLGVIRDTILVPFEDMNFDIWKYKSEANKPTLDTKVMRALSRGETGNTEELEKERFEELMDGLSLQLSLSLKRDRKLPYEERDPRMIVFEHVLKFVAKAEIWLETVAAVDPSQHTESTSQSQGFPARALRGWIDFSSSVANELKATSRWLDKSGQMIRDARTNYLILRKLEKIASDIIEEQGERKETLLADLFTELEGAKKRILTGEVKGITGMTLELIDALFGTLAAYKNGGIGTFIFGLDAASTSYFRGKKGGVFGPIVKELLTLTATSGKQTTAEQERVIPRVIGAGMYFYSLFSLVASGFQVFADKDDPRLTKESITSLALSLGTCLLAESEVIPKASAKLYKTIGIGEKDQILLIVLGDLFAMNLLPMNASAGKNKMKSDEQFRQGTLKKAGERLAVLKRLLEEADSELAAGVGQAAIALKRNEAVGYFEAIARMSKPMGWTMDDIQEEAGAAITNILETIRSFKKVEEVVNFIRVMTEAA